MNVYQYSVLAVIFAAAINEIRLSNINNLSEYPEIRIIFLYSAYVYVYSGIIFCLVAGFFMLGKL